MKYQMVCPVCKGKGIITNSSAPEKCRTCDGKGIIIIEDFPVMPFKEKEIE